MFQFRAFPPYTYLIQCTVHRYCLCGFPHSEISGSMDICSSPKLFAACHVLHRLLMPRHSPCALYSLTVVDASSVSLLPPPSLTARRRKCARSAASPLRLANACAALLVELGIYGLLSELSSSLVRDTLVLLNYAGNLQILLQN